MKKSYRLTWRGQTKTLDEWEQETGISKAAIRERRRRGWPIDKVLTQPVQVRQKAGAKRPCGAVTMYDCLKCPYKDCILPGSMRLDGESYLDNGGEK